MQVIVPVLLMTGGRCLFKTILFPPGADFAQSILFHRSFHRPCVCNSSPPLWVPPLALPGEHGQGTGITSVISRRVPGGRLSPAGGRIRSPGAILRGWQAASLRGPSAHHSPVARASLSLASWLSLWVNGKTCYRLKADGNSGGNNVFSGCSYCFLLLCFLFSGYL